MHDAQASGTSGSRIVFAKRSPFYQELRRRTDDYFVRAGMSTHATPAMVVKTAVLGLWFAVSYGLYIVFGGHPLWALPLAVSTGLAMAGLGFSVQHDGSHKAYSRRRSINRAMAIVMDLLGASSYIWRWQHNVLHHTYTNIDGLDHDIEMGGVARMAPSQPRHWFHRYQHLYVWPPYTLATIKWHLVDDFKMLVVGRVGDYRFPRPRGRELWIFVLGRMVFFGWAIALPLAIHGPGSALLFYLGCQLTAGLTLSVTFQLAHCVEEMAWDTPQPGSRLEKEWAIHQIETTRDFARSNRLLSWYVGGLNYQVEHHLFPKICHVHYPGISAIVDGLCRERGVTYRAFDSLLSALSSHYRWLRRMGTATDSVA